MAATGYDYTTLRDTTIPRILQRFGQFIEIIKVNNTNLASGRVVPGQSQSYRLLAVETTRSIIGAQSRDESVEGIESTDRIFNIQARQNVSISVGDQIVVNGQRGIISVVKRTRPAGVVVIYTVGAGFE